MTSNHSSCWVCYNGQPVYHQGCVPPMANIFFFFFFKPISWKKDWFRLILYPECQFLWVILLIIYPAICNHWFESQQDVCLVASLSSDQHLYVEGWWQIFILAPDVAISEWRISIACFLFFHSYLLTEPNEPVVQLVVPSSPFLRSLCTAAPPTGTCLRRRLRMTGSSAGVVWNLSASAKRSWSWQRPCRWSMTPSPATDRTKAQQIRYPLTPLSHRPQGASPPCQDVFPVPLGIICSKVCPDLTPCLTTFNPECRTYHAPAVSLTDLVRSLVTSWTNGKATLKEHRNCCQKGCHP